MPSQQSGRRGQDQGNKNQQSPNMSKRGFASMDDDKQREAASRGGEASGGDPERAAQAGKKGGQSSGGGDRGGSDRGNRS